MLTKAVPRLEKRSGGKTDLGKLREQVLSGQQLALEERAVSEVSAEGHASSLQLRASHLNKSSCSCWVVWSL